MGYIMDERQFGDVRVGDVMATEMPIVEVSTALCKVARMLRRASHVWVVQERGSREVLGIVTEREFLELLSPMPDKEYATGMIRTKSLLHGDMSTADEFMTKPVVSCSPSTNVETALEILREKRIRRLAVIDDGRLVGEISLKGIIAAYYISSCSMTDSQ